MRNTSKLVAALFVALGLGTAALPTMAQPGMGGMGCSPMEMGGKYQERRAQRMEQRQQQLHDALKLSADQEAGWKKFNESVPGPMMKQQGLAADWSSLPAPERAEKMLELSKRHQERMTAHVAALKTFYATLTPEQKKTFDGFHIGPHGGRRGPPAAAPAPATK